MMTPPGAQLHTIQYLAIEHAPLTAAGTLDPIYADLDPVWRVALRFLIRDVGRARCEGTCGLLIGYSFPMQDDAIGAGDMAWTRTCLVKLDDHGIVRLCDDCFPTMPTSAPVLRADPTS